MFGLYRSLNDLPCEALLSVSFPFPFSLPFPLPFPFPFPLFVLESSLVNAFKVFAKLMVAETLNAVMHAVLVSSTGVEMPFHLLSNAVTIVLIVIGARAGVIAGLGTITAGIYASLIWVWFTVCSALIIVLESSLPNAPSDQMPWQGMVFGAALLAPIVIVIGICAAWAARKLSKPVAARTQ